MQINGRQLLGRTGLHFDWVRSPAAVDRRLVASYLVISNVLVSYYTINVLQLYYVLHVLIGCLRSHVLLSAPGAEPAGGNTGRDGCFYERMRGHVGASTSPDC